MGIKSKPFKCYDLLQCTTQLPKSVMYYVNIADSKILFCIIIYIILLILFIYNLDGYNVRNRCNGRVYPFCNILCQTAVVHVSARTWVEAFCDSKQDDNDILRQMRTVYAKSNTLLRTFSHCSTEVKVTLCQSYCAALYCPFLWSDYKESTFRKIRVAFNNACRKSLVFPRGVVPVLCMLNIIFVTLKQRYGKAYYGFMQGLENSTNSITCTMYNLCLVRFVIWNHWI